jgi:RNA polymerase sigma factor (sigma-70 family)
METGMTDQQVQKFVTDHLDTVALTARKARKMYPFCDYDDLHSCGVFGAIRAAKSFVAAKGASFKTYAWRAIWGEMMEHVAREVAFRRNLGLSIDAMHDGADDTISERIAAPEGESKFEASDEWDHLVSPLDRRTRDIVLRIARDGETGREVSRQMGRSESLVSLALRNAGEVLRKTTLAEQHIPERVAGARGEHSRRPKPVVSDRGEWFPSAVGASRAMGVARTTVAVSIGKGVRCRDRRWSYVTEGTAQQAEVAA